MKKGKAVGFRSQEIALQGLLQDLGADIADALAGIAADRGRAHRENVVAIIRWVIVVYINNMKPAEHAEPR